MKMPRMIRTAVRAVRDTGGFGAVEALVAVILLSVLLGGVTQMFLVANQSRRLADEEVDRWAASEVMIEEIMATDPGPATSGTDTIAGFPVSWSVVGEEPSTVTVILEPRPGSILSRSDTIVTRRR